MSDTHVYPREIQMYEVFCRDYVSDPMGLVEAELRRRDLDEDRESGDSMACREIHKVRPAGGWLKAVPVFSVPSVLDDETPSVTIEPPHTSDLDDGPPVRRHLSLVNLDPDPVVDPAPGQNVIDVFAALVEGWVSSEPRQRAFDLAILFDQMEVLGMNVRSTAEQLDIEYSWDDFDLD